MVACTFISGPIIFISAKMISLTKLQPSDFFPELEGFSFDICVIGILMSVATLIIFTVTKKHQKQPHKVTCCLLISQVILCVGVIMWSYFEVSSIPLFYTQFTLYTFGCISSRIWCAISAITLLFIQYRSLQFVQKMTPIFVSILLIFQLHFIITLFVLLLIFHYVLMHFDLSQMCIGWGIPGIVVGCLLIFDGHNIKPITKRNPNFQYGNAQASISLFVLVISFIGKHEMTAETTQT